MKNKKTKCFISNSTNKKEEQNNTGHLFTEAEVMERLGLTEEDIDSVGEIEIEWVDNHW